MGVDILIYGREDLKTNGDFKKKFIQNWIKKEEFFKYLKDNAFNIKSDYIDVSGSISNGKRFRCCHSEINIIIGVSGVVKEFNENES